LPAIAANVGLLLKSVTKPVSTGNPLSFERKIMGHISVMFDVGETVYHLDRLNEQVTRRKVTQWAAESRPAPRMYEVIYTLSGCEYDVESRDVFAEPASAFEEIAYAVPA
jgi:hypothetical protein